MNDSRKETLADVLAQHAISLPEAQVGQLGRYCRLLWDVNQRLNLTRHTDYQKFVTRDLVDSLQLAEHLEPGSEVLDVGTGGGVPGVILAVLRPDVQVELCDSVGKKAKAVQTLVQQLGLSVAVHHARAEELLEDFRYDVLVARAVGPMSKILRWLKPHWPSIGKLLLVKGPKWPEERRDARSRGLLKDLELRRVATYPMYDTDSESVILALWPTDRRGSQSSQ